MPDEDRQSLNPQIATATVGRRTLRNIKIYPMSVGDQLSMTSMIQEAMSSLGSAEDETEMAGVAIKLIENNLPLVIQFITDCEGDEETKELLNDITNTQAVTIAEIVYEQNYAELVKKVKGLFKKAQEKMDTLPLKRPSQPSVKSTDIDSETSIVKDSETVD